MNQLPFSRMGEAIDLITQGHSLKSVALATRISHQCLFRSLLPRVGHGASVLCDILFENTAEHLNYADPFWPHEGYRRQLKTMQSTYALAAMWFLYERTVCVKEGDTTAMRLGVLCAPWTPENFARMAIEATRWSSPRWPSVATAAYSNAPKIYMLLGQPVAARHLAELAGCSVVAMERRLARGDTPEEAIRPRARTAVAGARS